jgi:phosphoribosyl 1,2-cyclic phosphodiesterase
VEEHVDGSDSLLILDAGSGIRPLGNLLLERWGDGIEVDLILSHTHWDHIQGLPFFAPLFGDNNQVRIWGPQQGNVDLAAILRNQMDSVVFPVPLDGTGARLSVSHLEVGSLPVGGFEIEAVRVRHPGNTLGYRLKPKSGGASMAYVTDNELGSGGNYEVGPSWRGEFVRFLQGVEVLVHDAMYTPEEIGQFRGWGHSSYGETVELAVEAGVDSLVLFHHRPEHDDATMDTLVYAAREMADTMGHSLEVVAATEGMELTL